VIDSFGAALADDLNTPAALAVAMTYLKDLNTQLEGGLTPSEAARALATWRRLDAVLGVIKPLEEEIGRAAVPPSVRQLAAEREAARQARDFGRADELRAQIEQQGFTVEDTNSGPRILPA
jgi:cysteinyl-tRNA synthetase